MDFNTNLSGCGRALICWLFLIPAALLGQSNWSDITFGEAEGLPQKEIYQCIEDDDHQIFVATDQGVFRINGNEVTRYTVNDGLGNNTVLKLFKDLDGKIWAACFRGGVRYFENNRWITPSFNNQILEDYSSNNFPYKIIFTEDQYIYIQAHYASGILHEINLSDSSVFTLNIPSPEVEYRMPSYLLWYEDQVVISGKIESRYAKNDLGSLKVMASSSKAILRQDTAFISSPRGTFLVEQIQYPMAFDVLYGSHRTFCKRIEDDQSLLMIHGEWLMTRDSLGQLRLLTKIKSVPLDMEVIGKTVFVATSDNGLMIFRFEHGAMTLVSQELEGETISNLLIDSNNNLWISVMNRGLVRISLPLWSSSRIESASNIVNLPLHFTSDTSAICPVGSYLHQYTTNKESNYSIWNLTSSIEVEDMVTTRDRVQYTSRTDNFISSKCYSMELENPNSLVNWIPNITTQDYSLIRQSRLSESKKSLHIILKPEVVSIYEKGKLDTLYHQDSTLEAKDFTLDGDSVEYVATNRGIWKRAGNRIVPHTHDSLDIYEVRQAPHNWNFALAKSQGLLLFNEDTVIELTRYNYLIDHFQSTIYSDQNRIYAASSNSFFIAEIGEGGIENFYNYYYHEIPGLEEISCFTHYENELIVFDNNEIFSVCADELMTSTTHVGFEVKSILVNGSKRELFNQRLPLNRGENTIEIQLKPNIPLSKGKPLFLWKTKTDDEWQESTNGEFTLVNLSSGTYNLWVKYRDERGRWMDETRLFNFSVRLPLIQTTWFWALVSSPVLIFLVYLNYTSRRRRILNKELIESNMASLKMQINPHFIFNAFNSIQYLIDTRKNTQASEYLGRLAKLIRKTISRPELHRVSLHEELVYIKEFLTIERMRLDNVFDFTIEVNILLDEDQVFIPPMLLQPILENSVWHGVSATARKGIISIRIEENENSLEIHLKDNGKGFPRDKWEAILMGKDTSGSLALQNVLSRLKLLSVLYNKNYRLELMEGGLGTHFLLTLSK